MTEQLKIAGVQLRGHTQVTKEEFDRGVRNRLHIGVEVQNAASAPLHVWSSRRYYDYDSSTQTLSVHLAEPTADPPPNIKLISDHPRVPTQTLVGAGAHVTIEVLVPTTIRRRAPAKGLGMSFVEEPIEEIARVELLVQHADVPFQRVIGETPRKLRQRLRQHGHVVSATLTPVSKEQ